MTAFDPSSVRGVIFDLDGTLYRMRRFMRPLLFLRLFPRSLWLPHLIRERSRFAGKDLGSRDRFLEQLCRALAVRERTTPETVDTWIHNRFYPSFTGMMSLQRTGRPGLLETLHHLKNGGIQTAVLSDYHSVQERLAGLRIPVSLFDTVTSCEFFGALKPAPRPFLEIAGRWNEACASILVVGDRTDTDGEAARHAGMQFLLLSDRSKDPSCHWHAARDRLMSITPAVV